jgi:fermentation-respiration switch protein FrsA (DUF1100 family)
VKIGLVLVILAVALTALAWTLQRWLIYFPFGRVPDPASVGLSAAAVSFPSADGLTLGGWLAGDPGAARLTAIVFNGNAGNRAFRAPLAHALARHDIAVLLFDYRGYGGNPGAPSEAGLRADARAARDFVLQRGAENNRLVYLGESLGAAVAAELAVAHPPAAVILRSPFTSLAEIGEIHYGFLPVRWLLRDRFATIDRIDRMRAPLLVIAGDRDRIVPVEQSRMVFDRANEPKSLLIVNGADHNDDALLAGSEMIRGILAFVDAWQPSANRPER